MDIRFFESTGLKTISNYLYDNDLNKKELLQILKTANVSFVIENLTLLETIYILEKKASTITTKKIEIVNFDYKTPFLTNVKKERYEMLIQQIFELYKKMKEEGITDEALNYILPLSLNNNLAIAMTGDKLLDFIELITDEKHMDLFNTLYENLQEYIPENVLQKIEKYVSYEDYNEIEDFYSDMFKKINNRVINFDVFYNPDFRMGLSALILNKNEAPHKKINDWVKDEETSFYDIIEKHSLEELKNIHGHDFRRLNEQMRYVQGFKISLYSYFYYVKNRMPKNIRENFYNILKNANEPYIPKELTNSKYYEKFLDLYEEIKIFRKSLVDKYRAHTAFNLLLNCDTLKIINSSNLRIDIEIAEELKKAEDMNELTKIFVDKFVLLSKESKIFE